MLVHVIADYGQGDLAFAEVAQRLKLYVPDAAPTPTPVPPFATLAAGFCIAQLGLNDAPPGTLIYHNVAPRADDEAARADNAGERLACALLPTGVRVVGVNAGYAYAFLRDVADELRWVAVPAAGSQFRSRDLFPRAAAAIALGRLDVLAGPIDPADIPDVPRDHVAYVDGYGNLKLTTTPAAHGLARGMRVRAHIGGVEREAIVSDGSFDVAPGELAFAPGSSGWTTARGGEARWMELFLRGGSAWEHFGRPATGVEVRISA